MIFPVVFEEYDSQNFFGPRVASLLRPSQEKAMIPLPPALGRMLWQTYSTAVISSLAPTFLWNQFLILRENTAPVGPPDSLGPGSDDIAAVLIDAAMLVAVKSSMNVISAVAGGPVFAYQATTLRRLFQDSTR